MEIDQETGMRIVLGAAPEGANHFAVMGTMGDTKYIWDSDNAAEVEIARNTFDSFRKKGYAAFKVKGKEGMKGEQVDLFDPKEERYVFVPPMKGG